MFKQNAVALAKKSYQGFTLIELLVVISIIAILSVVGMTIFSSVQKSARDAVRKSDVNAIAKAYEVHFSGGFYHVLNPTNFGSGTVPQKPEGGDYDGILKADAPGFQVCAALENHPSGESCDPSFPTCFCIRSSQGVYVAAGSSPSPGPSSSPAPSSTPTPIPTPTPISTPTPAPTPISGTIDVQVTASLNDATDLYGLSQRNDDYNLVTDVNGSGTRSSGLRFVNITIPQGATITAAYIRIALPNGGSTNIDANIYADDADNSADFANANPYVSARIKTTALVRWTAINAPLGYQQSPSIISVVQEIIDRSGWLSGNSLSILMFGIDLDKMEGCSYDNSLTGSPYEYGCLNKPPTLYIAYSYLAPTPSPTPSPTPGPANLLSNPGFELSVDPWGSWQGSVSRVPGGHGGSYSGQVTYVGGSFPGYYSIDNGPPGEIYNPAQGQVYQASVWVKGVGSAIGKQARLTIRVWDLPLDIQYETSGSGIIMTSNWQQLTATHTVANPNMTDLDIYALQDNAVAGDAFLVDDFFLSVSGAGSTPVPTPASTSTPAGSRDPLKWPFASNSIWNMPIGSGAVYVPANLNPDPGNIINNPWVPGLPSIDDEIIVLRPTAPLTDIYYSDALWDATKDRCVATEPLQLLNQKRMPSDFVVPGSGGNNAATFLEADNRTLQQTQPFTRCTANGYGTTGYITSDVDIYGDGRPGAHGGSGLSGFGGSIRMGELRPGQVGMNHVLKVNVYAKEAL
ncbi:MAG: prepilin-type N-terminal cleavage/methylation domain-containing protein [bacterium]|nr:prepilin-type N-terminal cleavage/methylation domain-containing protein [bacterium]